MINVICTLLGIVIVFITFPTLVLLFVLTLAAFLPYKKKRGGKQNIITKLAIVIPAHNEEAVIGRTLKSLQNCEGNFDIVVIADNCTDRTASVAKSFGIEVINRSDSQHQGKPYALSYAIPKLLRLEYEAILFVDADSVVKPNLILEVLEAFNNGLQALQVRYDSLSTGDSILTRQTYIGLLACNFLKPRGRGRLGLSAGILGNGFALTREVLETVPWNHYSLVEDLSYHLRLVEKGYRVDFLETTQVRGEVANHYTSAEKQRTRWEIGRFREAKEQLPVLIRSFIKGKFHLWEPILDLLTLPSTLFIFLMIVLFFFSPFKNYAVSGIGIFGTHLMSAIYLGGGTVKELCFLVFSPIYFLWKLGFYFKRLVLPNQPIVWERTKRNEEE